MKICAHVHKPLRINVFSISQNDVILCWFNCIGVSENVRREGGREDGKWCWEVKRSEGTDRWDGRLLNQYSESVSGTREVEDICFLLKIALGLSHDETQPGAAQHSKILPLVSPPPLANQEPADPEETLHQSCYSSRSSPPYFLQSLWCVYFIWELSSERQCEIGHIVTHILDSWWFFLMVMCVCVCFLGILHSQNDICIQDNL